MLTKMSPKIDPHGFDLLEYAAKMIVKYYKAKEALYEETKEWCTQYRCGHSLVMAYFLKMLDMVLSFALTVIYQTLDALMGVLLSMAGPVAKITDEVVIFLCYMFTTSDDPCACCDKSAILDAFVAFIQALFDAAYVIIKKTIEIVYRMMLLWEKLKYKCECERIEDELQTSYKNELESAKAMYGNDKNPDGTKKYENFRAVAWDPNPRDEKTFYLRVKSSKTSPSMLFKKHVDATVAMYNKWPYAATDDCPAAIATRVIAGVSWKTYVYILCANWLSSSNLKEGGYTFVEQEAMKDYCKAKMPTDLYNFMLYQLGTARPMCEMAEDENWAGRG